MLLVLLVLEYDSAVYIPSGTPLAYNRGIRIKPPGGDTQTGEKNRDTHRL